MSHAPTEVQTWVLDGGADDIPCDEVIIYWRNEDTDCHFTLSDLSEVIASRISPEVAAAQKADIQTRMADSSISTKVLKSHLDALGLTDAVLEWAQQD
jgi:hypothetical protein